MNRHRPAASLRSTAEDVMNPAIAGGEVPYLAEGAPHHAEVPPGRHYQNVAAAMFLFGARVLAAVVQLRLVERFWGASYTGLNALSNQVLLYVTLLELGLALSATTLLYEPILGRNYARVSALVRSVRHDVRRLAGWGAVAIPPLLVGFAFLVHSPLPFREVVLTLEMVAVSGLIQLAAVHYQAYLNACERIDSVNYILGCGYVLKTVIGLGLAVHFHEYLWLPGATAALTVIEFLALRTAFGRYFPDYRETDSPEASRAVRLRARYILVHKVGGLAYNQSDFIILSVTTSLAVVKSFAQYQYVSSALLSVVGMMAAALVTSIARRQLRQDKEARREQYYKAQLATCFIGAVLMLGFWFTAHTIVNLAFGPTAYPGRYVIALFAVALFTNVANAADEMAIAAKGAFEVGYWVPIIVVPLYFFFGITLSKRMGYPGVLVATIAINLLVLVMVRGAVLAQPVYESGRMEWFLLRARNMALALLLAAPLAGVYGAGAVLLRDGAVRFLAVNGLAALYCLLLVRKIITGRSGAGSRA